jgi:predicted ester cyclase
MRSMIGLLLILFLVAPEVRAADAKPQISCRGNERNLRTYLKIHEILFTQRDASRVTEFYADEVISHNLDSGGGGARTVKPEQLAAMWNASKRNNPQRRLVDELILCSGDFVTVRTWVHNHDATGMAGNAPTGKPYKISAIDIYRFKNGKVVERWGNSDLMSMAEQIGLRLVPVEPKP